LKHLEEMNPVNEDNINDEKLDEGEEKKFNLIIEETKNEISTSNNQEQNSTEENKDENKEENKKEIKPEEKKEIEKEEKEDKNNNDKNEIKEENKDIETNLSENSGNNNKEKTFITLLSNDEIKSEKKAATKVKDEREIQFIKFNININSPQLILKPRPSFSDYFIAELGKINIQAFYQKVTGKVYKDINDWRWLTTYQMRLTNCYISRNDGFEILSKTNGIVNMHFTNNTESDLLLPPNEIDKSFQFDVYFNEFSLN